MILCNMPTTKRFDKPVTSFGVLELATWVGHMHEATYLPNRLQ